MAGENTPVNQEKKPNVLDKTKHFFGTSVPSFFRDKVCCSKSKKPDAEPTAAPRPGASG